MSLFIETSSGIVLVWYLVKPNSNRSRSGTNGFHIPPLVTVLGFERSSIRLRLLV
ncbi:MAG: hypothetical protein QM736_14555 [Vicinamibacterales bacterium]